MTRLFTATAAIATLLTVASGCGEQPTDEATESVAKPLTVAGLPPGTVVALEWERPGSQLYGTAFMGLNSGHSNGQCSQPTTPAGFGWAGDGDRGLPACNGFTHFVSNSTQNLPSNQYPLPRGTDCGFKETCNDGGQTCMGFDANVSCPAGWTRKVGSDSQAPGGCGFVWCEYQDPFNLCTTTACQQPTQVDGLVCGITDNDRPANGNSGQCLGTITSSGACPAGYHWSNGPFDDGRSAGHGIGFCFRLTPPTGPIQ